MKRIIKNTWICLKYPFLWTRNRWTGLHYNNWDLLDYIKNNTPKGTQSFQIKYTHSSDESYGNYLSLGNLKYLRIDQKGEIILGKTGGSLERVVGKIKSRYRAYSYGWGIDGDRIIVEVSPQVDTDKPNFDLVTVTLSWKWKIWIKFLEFLHAWPLQILHCIPKYTELDSLPEGWRIRFGEDICKEIRRSLLKTGGLKALFGYRIVQIKEKFGTLRWYDGGTTEEIQEIIDKYEVISGKTCIVCGKPATYISGGWICPYCDEHIDNKDWADKIEEGEN